MTMTVTQSVITIAAVVLGTMTTRFLPFLVFPEGREPPAFIRYLGEHGVPFGIIFTKADKSKPGQLKSHINAFLHTLGEEWEELPPHYVTSSNDGTGRDELLNYIEQVNKSL